MATQVEELESISVMKPEREDKELLHEVTSIDLFPVEVKKLESKPNQTLEDSNNYEEQARNSPFAIKTEVNQENAVTEAGMGTNQGETFLKSSPIPEVVTNDSSSTPKDYKATTIKDQAEVFEIETLQEEADVPISKTDLIEKERTKYDDDDAKENTGSPYVTALIEVNNSSEEAELEQGGKLSDSSNIEVKEVSLNNKKPEREVNELLNEVTSIDFFPDEVKKIESKPIQTLEASNYEEQTANKPFAIKTEVDQENTVTEAGTGTNQGETFLNSPPIPEVATNDSSSTPKDDYEATKIEDKAEVFELETLQEEADVPISKTDLIEKARTEYDDDAAKENTESPYVTALTEVNSSSEEAELKQGGKLSNSSNIEVMEDSLNNKENEGPNVDVTDESTVKQMAKIENFKGQLPEFTGEETVSYSQEEDATEQKGEGIESFDAIEDLTEVKTEENKIDSQDLALNTEDIIAKSPQEEQTTKESPKQEVPSIEGAAEIEEIIEQDNTENFGPSAVEESSETSLKREQNESDIEKLEREDKELLSEVTSIDIFADEVKKLESKSNPALESSYYEEQTANKPSATKIEVDQENVVTEAGMETSQDETFLNSSPIPEVATNDSSSTPKDSEATKIKDQAEVFEIETLEEEILKDQRVDIVAPKEASDEQKQIAEEKLEASQRDEKEQVSGRLSESSSIDINEVWLNDKENEGPNVDEIVESTAKEMAKENFKDQLLESTGEETVGYSREEDPTEQKGEEIERLDAIEDLTEVKKVENKIDGQDLESNTDDVTSKSSQEDETAKERLEQEEVRTSIEEAAETEVQIIEEDNAANFGPSAVEESNEASLKGEQKESVEKDSNSSDLLLEEKSQVRDSQLDTTEVSSDIIGGNTKITEKLEEFQSDEKHVIDELEQGGRPSESSSIEVKEVLLNNKENEGLNVDVTDESTVKQIAKNENFACELPESTGEETVSYSQKDDAAEQKGEEIESFDAIEDLTGVETVENKIDSQALASNTDDLTAKSSHKGATTKESPEQEVTRISTEEAVEVEEITEQDNTKNFGPSADEESNEANLKGEQNECDIEANRTNKEIEEQKTEESSDNIDLPSTATEEIVTEYLKEDETDDGKSNDEVKNLEMDSIQNIDTKSHVEGTISHTEKDMEFDKDCNTQGSRGLLEEMHVKETNEDLVVNSSIPQVSQKEPEDDNLDKEESEFTVLKEERSIKEAEQESNSSDLLLEEKSQVIEVELDDVNSIAELAKATEIGENMNIEISKTTKSEADEAGEETVCELEDKTYTTIPKVEDNRELTSGETSIEQTLEESSAPSVTANQLGITEVGETVDGNTEITEISDSNVKTLVTAETTGEKLEKKENEAMDPIEDTLVELKDIKMDDVNAEENRESVEPLEVGSSIVSVAEEKSNETYLEINHAETDEDKQNANKQNLEAAKEGFLLTSDTTSEENSGEISQKGQNESKEVESKLEAELQINGAEHRIEAINDVALTEEVLGEAEKTEESEYVNEQIAEKESCTTELQVTSSSDQEPNKVTSSDLVASENHEAASFIENTGIEELQEIEEIVAEPEASSTAKALEEEKMEGDDKPVIITRSASEPSEENIEEVGNHGDGAETAPTIVETAQKISEGLQTANINNETVVVANPDIDKTEVEELNISDTEPIIEITETAKPQDITWDPEASPIAEAPEVEILKGTENSINFNISESALSEANASEENIEESGSQKEEVETAAETVMTAETSSEDIQLNNEFTRDMDTNAGDNDQGFHISLQDEAADSMELQESSATSELTTPEDAEINKESVVEEKSATDEVEELEISDVKPIIGNTETEELQVVEDINRGTEANSSTKAPEEEILKGVEKPINNTTTASELSEQNTRHEAVDSIELQEIDNMESQDSSVISQPASAEHEDVHEETMVVKESATDETEVEQLEISNVETEFYGQNGDHVHESEKISIVESSDTNTHEKETYEVLESNSEAKYQVAEGDKAPEQTHPAEDLTEQFQASSSATLLKEKELQATTTTEKVEDESPMKEETLVNEKESTIATNPEEDTISGGQVNQEIEDIKPICSVETSIEETLDSENSTEKNKDLLVPHSKVNSILSQEDPNLELQEIEKVAESASDLQSPEVLKSEETEMKEEQTQVGATESREKENLEEKLINEDDTIDDEISSEKTAARTEEDKDFSEVSLEVVPIQESSQEVEVFGENKDSTDDGKAAEDTCQDPYAVRTDSSSCPQETEKERDVKEALTRLDLQETNWNDSNVEAKSPNQETEGVTVENGEAKEIEDIKEELVEEDGCIRELQTTSVSEETTNETAYSDPETVEKLESNFWSIETKPEELKPTEDVNLESEAPSITETSEKEIGEEKIKEVALISETDLEEVQEVEKLINQIEKADNVNEKIEDTNSSEKLSEDLPWIGAQGKAENNVAGAGDAIINSNQDSVVEVTAGENISQEAVEAKSVNELPREVETQETANQTDCIEIGVETIVLSEEIIHSDPKGLEIFEATDLTTGTEIESLRAEDLNSKSEALADEITECNENPVNTTSPVAEVPEEDIKEENVEADSITDTPPITLVKETSSEEVQQGEQRYKSSDDTSNDENAETKVPHMSQEDEEDDSVKLDGNSSMVAQISGEQHAFIGTEEVTAENPNANKEAEVEEIITSDRALASIGQDPKDVCETDEVRDKIKLVPDSVTEETEVVQDFVSSASVPIGENRETVSQEELITTYEYVAKDQIDEPLPDKNGETDDCKDQKLESTVEKTIGQDFQEAQSVNKEVGHKLEEENAETQDVNKTKKDVFLMDDKSQEAFVEIQEVEEIVNIKEEITRGSSSTEELKTTSESYETFSEAVEEIQEVEEIVNIKEEITEGGSCTEELKTTSESDENLSQITNSDPIPFENVEEIRSSVNTEEVKLLTAEDFSGKSEASFASTSPEDVNQGIKKTADNINSSEESKTMVEKEKLEKVDTDMKKENEILNNPDVDEIEVEKYKENEIEDVQIDGVSIGVDKLEERDLQTEDKYQAEETVIEGGKIPDLTYLETKSKEEIHESSSSEMIRREQDWETTNTGNKVEDESEKKDGTLVTELAEDSLESRTIESALPSKENPKELQVSQNIEEVLEYMPEARSPNTVTESEVTEIEEVHTKTATIASTDEESQSQIANEKARIMTKEVSSDKTALDKEVAEDSLLLSAEEGKNRESCLKDEVVTLDYRGEDTNQITEATNICIPTEESSHELEKAGEIKNIVSLGDRNVSEILPEEIKEENCLKEAPTELNLQEQSDETGSRDRNTEDKTVIEERNVSELELIKHDKDKAGPIEMNNVTPNYEVRSRDIEVSAVADAVIGEEKITVDEKKKRSEEPSSAIFPLSELMERSTKETSEMVPTSFKESEPTDNREDGQPDKAQTDEGEGARKDEEKEEEGDENEKVDSGSDAPVMVEVARDVDVKVCKKSHGILSGVGSKVKHSISKVKKVITGKSSHPKSSSPK